MNLEDTLSDVLAKALRGHGLGSRQLSEKSGISESLIAALLRGASHPEALLTLAPILDLRAEALQRFDAYTPIVPLLPKVRVLSLPFLTGQVNAFLIEHEQGRLLFDTGFSSPDLREALSDQVISQAFITHSHPDHIGGIELCHELGIPVISPEEALFQKEFRFGKVIIRAIDLSGHAVPATGYLIEGLSQRFFIVGDALFAGSMGGCKTTASYQLALKTLRQALRNEPDELILLPGHGPITTLGQERASNPFPLFS